MSTNENTACDRAELIPDYAFDELASAERRIMEQHLTQCSACATELDQLRLTTAALRVLPDREVPRRIAFVSEKVFGTTWLSGFWNSAARLGFASACVLAAGLSFAAYHRQPAPQPVVQTAQVPHVVTQVPEEAIQEAVNKAVAAAVDKAHAEDIQMTKAALAAVDSKYAEKQRNLMVAMQETLDYERKRYDYHTARAMFDETPPRMGASQ